MEKNLLVVCDMEPAYTSRLTDYLSRKKNVPFEVHAFTKVELLKDFASDKRIDVLLLSGEAAYELKKLDGDVSAEDVFILSEEAVGATDEAGELPGCRYIFKYQSTENILREIMCRYADSASEVSSRMKSIGKTGMVAVYSPVKRSLKTSFAMTLGQLLSQRSRTLYINLEEYSGFNSLLRTNYATDMSDLMYYIKQQKPNFIWKLASIVQNVGGLDYIPPAIAPPDIKAVSCDQWMGFFSKLDKCGYENVILDLGETVDGLFDILRMCKRVYTPVRDDAVSYAKMEQYEAMLGVMDYSDVLEKTRKLSFSHFEDMGRGLDRLVYSELGAYVAELLAGEKAFFT